MRTRALIAFIIPLAAFATTAAAADYYVDPSGSPTAAGSFADPWDLDTALHHPAAVQAGDTIWLRGGTYTGAHTSRLAGTSGTPITVRAYQRERVVLDHAAAANCNPSETDECSPNNKRCNALSVPACSHDVVFRDLELWNSTAAGRISVPAGGCTDAPECCYVDGVAPPLKPECGETPSAIARSAWQPVYVAGDRVKLVNCVIHDGGTGLTADQAAIDTEIYGALVFNNGWGDPASGHGPGLSIENQNPSWRKSHKQVRNTVLWNNFGDGYRSVVPWGRLAHNLLLEDVVSFNNGAPTASYYASDIGLFAAQQGVRYGNVFLNSDELLMYERLRRCRLYQPTGTTVRHNYLGGVEGANLEFNKDIIVEDSYIATSGPALSLIRWDTMRMTGTTLIGGATPQVGDTETLARIEKTECPDLLAPTATWPAFAWDDNKYHFTGSGASPFMLNLSTPTLHTFSSWRSTLYNRDAGSTYAIGLPTSNAVFVQPNEYEAGRAHVAIYNWLGLASVPVDLSTTGLVNGQGYKVYNLQAFTNTGTGDYFGTVVAQGVYNSSSPIVNVGMNDSSVTSPVGLPHAVVSTLPQFGAFLVRSTLCGNGEVNDGEACDDGNFGAGDGCNNCVVEPCFTCAGSPSVCSPVSFGTACPADANPCTDSVCDGSGGCGVANSAPCDDGLFCNGVDICGGGSCHPGGNPCPGANPCTACNEATDLCLAPAGASCADEGNPCTDDECNGAGICQHPSNSDPCDDGNACTTGEVCAGGSCGAGVHLDCDDGNPCTADSCNTSSGCVHTNLSGSCDDGSVCTTGDTCNAGVCTGSPISCADTNPCTQDSCDAISGCAHAPVPRAACSASKSRLTLNDNGDDTKDVLQWKWIQGSANLAEFGDPTATSASTLCVYDDSGIVARADVPAAGTCGGQPCWKSYARGFKYKDTAASSFGIRKVLEKSSPSAKVVLVGKGMQLPDPSIAAISGVVTVQWSNPSGCVGATFPPGQVIKKTATLFKAKNF